MHLDLGVAGGDPQRGRDVFVRHLLLRSHQEGRSIRLGKGLKIAIQTEFDEVGLTDEGCLAVYRLVQEALTNVSKYAQATQVRVTVKSDPPVVRVQVEDDGIGFDPTEPRSATHGIAGMRFRIEQLEGSLSLESRPGAGTRLVAIMPLAPAAAAAGESLRSS